MGLRPHCAERIQLRSVPRRLVVGCGRRHRCARRRAAAGLPARDPATAAGHQDGAAARVLRDARTTGDLPPCSRQCAAASGDHHGVRRVVPRRRALRDRLAGDDGECGAQWRRGSCSGVEPPARTHGGGGMTIALPTTLLRTREAVEPALREAVNRLAPESRRLSRYHFGWTDADGRPSADNGGKAVRPAFALLSAQAVRASWQIGLPGAVAVELVHNFSLLHDDLMDGDVGRRPRPTVVAVAGAPAAILCGDAMLALATQVLLDVGTLDAVEATRLLAASTQELIRGQYDDLAFESRNDVTVEECVAMAAGKTGALLACSAAIGAVLAGAPASTADALSTYGAELGLAFQLVDDLLGIWGDSASTGKPVGSDLRARKKSLPITWAAGQPGAPAQGLRAWLATEGPDSDADIARAAGLVEAAGGRGWAADEALRRLDRGEAALDAVPLDSDARAELKALGRFIVTRES